MSVLWSRRLADELWSGPVTPLTYDLLAEPMAEHLVRRRLAGAGYANLAQEPIFRRVSGRVYVNATLVAEVMSELPSLVLTEGLLEHIPAELRSSVAGRGRRVFDLGLSRTLFRISCAETRWLPWQRASFFASEALRLRPDPSTGLTEMDSSAIISCLDGLLERLGGFLDATSWLMIYAYVFFYLTRELLSRWAPEAGVSMEDLLTGAEGIRTFEVRAQLQSCGALLRNDSSWRARLLQLDSAAFAHEVIESEGQFPDEFRKILNEHGHRLVGRDLSRPTWREAPGFLVEALGAFAKTPAPERAARGDDARRRVEVAIGRGPGGRLRLVAWRQALQLCSQYYAARENMRYHADFFLASLRQWALSGGDRLRSSGSLAQVDDVFFLGRDELVVALSSGGLPVDNALLDERRMELAETVRVEPASLLRGDETVSREPAPPGCLEGTVVAMGFVEGPARVILRAEDLAAVKPGEILIAAATDPSWIAALSLAAGIVLEVGGELSHGAIVARELGIPAIVGVAGATKMLATGDTVCVDGDRGRVLLG